MGFLREVCGRVHLFIGCYVDAAYESSGDGLTNKSVPLWALMRTGSMSTIQGHEVYVGINRDSGLKATYEQESWKLLSTEGSTKAYFQPLINRLPKNLRKRVTKLHGTPSFVEKKIITGTQPLFEELYGAVLLRLDDARKLTFATEDGHGVFLREKDLKSLLDKAKANSRKWKRFGAMKQRGDSPMKGISFTLPQYRVNGNTLNIDLHGGIGELQFMYDAMVGWRKASEKERQANYEEAGKHVYGAAIGVAA